jgi:hypothetical protein
LTVPTSGGSISSPVIVVIGGFLIMSILSVLEKRGHIIYPFLLRISGL